MTAATKTVLEQALRGAGILGDGEPSLTPLTGGVSSDIWKLEAGGETLCVKQALGALKVEAEWHAPVERNRFEVRWNEIANRVAPGSAPRVRFHDGGRMFFVMDYLDPQHYRPWKDELMAGRVDASAAFAVGAALSRIHAAAAGDEAVAAEFPRTDIFHAIRLEPYFLATAARHPDLAARLEQLVRTTAGNLVTMIHGDVSPKNILIGPDGPVFLDAECACIGDPAFDIAFCLNHMLLKCLWRPPASESYLDCFDAMRRAYLSGVDWEPEQVLEARAAALLPAMLLARVDGKSPVEYITEETDRDKVRRCARFLIESEPERLDPIPDAWREEFKR